MMYVSERNADSICDTALLFLVMKSEYMPSHLGGCDNTSVVFCAACLYIVGIAPISAGLAVIVQLCLGVDVEGVVVVPGGWRDWVDRVKSWTRVPRLNIILAHTLLRF